MLKNKKSNKLLSVIPFNSAKIFTAPCERLSHHCLAGNWGFSYGSHLHHIFHLQWHHRSAGAVLLERLSRTAEEEEKEEGVE